MNVGNRHSIMFGTDSQGAISYECFIVALGPGGVIVDI